MQTAQSQKSPQAFGDKETRDRYFSLMRRDVLSHIPPEVKDVLSIGCGGGVTEGELVRQGKNVVGVELDITAAADAREKGLTVLCGDVNEITAQLESQEFDCVMYADVLEHIVDPQPLVDFHASLLRPGGTVVISVPNFRYYLVFWHQFIRGCIPYTDAGIFDRTHVRITTRQLVEQWLRGAGLEIEQAELRLVRRRDRWLSRMSLNLLREFFSVQVIVVAKKPSHNNK